VLERTGAHVEDAAVLGLFAEGGLAQLPTRHRRRPQTNGKAETFVKLAQNGWAYRRLYASGDERTATLDCYLVYYNHFRPHGGLDGLTPMQCLAL
jgi:transposase InsO family protein